jgi:hypothetical protein
MFWKPRQSPRFNIGSARGTADSPNFANLLSKELHRRFDSTAAESLPRPISDLISQLEPPSRKVSD